LIELKGKIRDRVSTETSQKLSRESETDVLGTEIIIRMPGLEFS
jgi:hypothetical protein